MRAWDFEDTWVLFWPECWITPIAEPFLKALDSTLSVVAFEGNQRSPGRLLYQCKHHQCIIESLKGFGFVTFVTKPSVQCSLHRVVQGLRRRLNQSRSTGVPWKVQFRLHQVLWKLQHFILPLYPQDLGATNTEAFPRKLCREACKDIDGGPAETWDLLQPLPQIQMPSSPTSCILLNCCILFWRDKDVSHSPEIQRKELYTLHWMT